MTALQLLLDLAMVAVWSAIGVAIWYVIRWRKELRDEAAKRLMDAARRGCK